MKKADVEHVVPLPTMCVAFLDDAKRHIDDSVFIFPRRMLEKPISDMALGTILLPKQRHRHAAPLHLGVNSRPVGLNARRSLDGTADGYNC